jgi:hypothetical protein
MDRKVQSPVNCQHRKREIVKAMGVRKNPIATKLRRRRKPKPRSGSKKAKVLAMLRRPGGASMSNFRKRPDGKRIRYADLSAHT